jgi:hypothetical protein
MAQFVRFNDGGFVLHKCLGKRLSAWYDKTGELTDHELIDSLGRSRKAGKDDIETLHLLGHVYARSDDMNNSAII